MWIKKDKNCGYAYCSTCRSSFRIDNSGLSQVKTHASSASRKAKEELFDGKTSQRVLVSTSSNTMSLSSGMIKFTLEEQVLRAETLQALDCVESNYSFSSAKMIVKNLKQCFQTRE